MIGTSPSAYAPMRVKCSHRWSCARRCRVALSRAVGVATDATLHLESDEGTGHARASTTPGRTTMPRTPLATRVQEAVSNLDEARTTRRQLLERGAALGAAAAGASTVARTARAASRALAPKIVVVGGGLAGLTATYRLQQAGYAADLHEASGRLG